MDKAERDEILLHLARSFSETERALIRLGVRGETHDRKAAHNLHVHLRRAAEEDPLMLEAWKLTYDQER